MQQNKTYCTFAAVFAKKTSRELIDSFNRQVGNRGFNAHRAAHDVALIDTLIGRGIDVSAVYDGSSISFSHPVTLDASEKSLIWIII